MKNIIDFIKDKIYYFMGGTVLLFVILLIVSACSSNGAGSSYEKIEQNMVSAAKSYYAKKSSALPVTEAGTVKVTLSALVESEYIKEVKDPKDKTNICTGYVEVTKVGDDYSYIPFLTCKGNYEPKYLSDKIKTSELDEYSNGVYEENGEYIYKGKYVNNYVLFNNQTWRILKIDSEGDIKLMLSKYLEYSYEWDNSYNSISGSNDGVTNDYLHSNIRKSLYDYYDKTFDKDAKAKIVPKNLCVGAYAKSDAISRDTECAVIKEKENIALINVTDFKNASLDTACMNIDSNECQNQNYLSEDYGISTWTANPSTTKSYKVLFFSDTLYESGASNAKKVNPVIYLTSKAITNEGNGTIDKPYIIK